jgi:hypothetical protein
VYIKDLKVVKKEIKLRDLPNGGIIITPVINNRLNNWVDNGSSLFGPLLRYMCDFKGLITVSNDPHFALSCASNSRKVIVSLEDANRDDCAEITIDDNEMRLTYDVNTHSPSILDNNSNIILTLKRIEYKNEQNHFSKSLCPSDSAISVFNNWHTASLDVHNASNAGIFILPYEESLKDLLLQVKLPTSINQLYKEIINTVGPLDRYPSAKFKIADNSNGPIEKPTDIIELKEGKLITYMRTNKDLGYSIRLLPNGKYNISFFGVHDIGRDTISKTVDSTSEEIEKDKTFIKSFLKS